jgi:hypothetical protein
MKIMSKNSSANVRETPHAPILENDHDDASPREKIEALAEMICGAGDQSAAALFVFMATIQHSSDPAALAHSMKHVSFTRCGELNVYGMVDAHIATIERELFASNTVVN